MLNLFIEFKARSLIRGEAWASLYLSPGRESRNTL